MTQRSTFSNLFHMELSMDTRPTLVLWPHLQIRSTATFGPNDLAVLFFMLSSLEMLLEPIQEEEGPKSWRRAQRGWRYNTNKNLFLYIYTQPCHVDIVLLFLCNKQFKLGSHHSWFFPTLRGSVNLRIFIGFTSEIQRSSRSKSRSSHEVSPVSASQSSPSDFETISD